MKNYKFGYARVSTEEQVLDRQIDMLSEYGVNQIYSEKMTGTNTVVIESLSRLGRSTKDLIELMELFNKKKVNLVSLKENIDTTTATGKLLFTLISAISQFERDCIADRTREGLSAARARGRKGGRPPISSELIDKAKRLYDTKEYTMSEIEELTGVKRATLY